MAYWAIGKLASQRVGQRARTAISIAVAVVVVLGISAACAGPAPSPPASPREVAAATASVSPAPQTPEVTRSVAPTATSTQAATSPSPTAVDGDDEAGPSAPPETSSTPGPTGVLFAHATPGSSSDRLPGEPDASLTPGSLNPAVTQATIDSTICVSGWTATIRPASDYTTALKIQQMTEYGYSDTSTSSYEEDHLISLELGGAPTDPRNLWPEPYTAALSDGRPTGAHVKDGFETKLKDEVCNGTVTLNLAQSEIGDNWVHAYYGIPLASSTPTAGPTPTPTATLPPTAAPTSAPTPAPTAPPRPALSVRITSLPAKVRHGAGATIAAVTSRGATCTVSVTYASGTVSTAKGLAPTRTASSTGKVSWTWTVGSRTGPGTSTAEVDCSLAGDFARATKNFLVTT